MGRFSFGCRPRYDAGEWRADNATLLERESKAYLSLHVTKLREEQTEIEANLHYIVPEDIFGDVLQSHQIQVSCKSDVATLS